MSKAETYRAAYEATRKKVGGAVRTKKEQFLGRRPHRSFQLTRRRDYQRTLKIPGFFAFTAYVHRTLWRYRNVFLGLIVVYTLLSGILLGISSQESFSSLSQAVDEINQGVSGGGLSALGDAALLLGATLINIGSSSEANPTQQIYAVIIGLLVWLTTVWLLRNMLAGRAVKLRDAVYNAGAPIISTFVVMFVLVLQLIPIAIAAMAYVAAVNTGLLDNGVHAMLFWIAAVLLVTLSLYWTISSALALVVVTLPGMYPLRALSIAADMVVGRRIRLLLRVLWLGLVVVVAWAVTLLPLIVFDGFLKDMIPAISWLPLIPIALVVVSCLTVVWSASYVYLLYRKVVDDDAPSA